jgi:hypothetical protein
MKRVILVGALVASATMLVVAVTAMSRGREIRRTIAELKRDAVPQLPQRHGRPAAAPSAEELRALEHRLERLEAHRDAGIGIAEVARTLHADANASGVSLTRLAVDPGAGRVSVSAETAPAALLEWLRSTGALAVASGMLITDFGVTASQDGAATVELVLRDPDSADGSELRSAITRTRHELTVTAWPVVTDDRVAAVLAAPPESASATAERDSVAPTDASRGSASGGDLDEGGPDAAGPASGEALAAAVAPRYLGRIVVEGAVAFPVRLGADGAVCVFREGECVYGWRLVRAGSEHLILEKEGHRYAVPTR